MVIYSGHQHVLGLWGLLTLAFGVAFLVVVGFVLLSCPVAPVPSWGPVFFFSCVFHPCAVRKQGHIPSPLGLGRGRGREDFFVVVAFTGMCALLRVRVLFFVEFACLSILMFVSLKDRGDVPRRLLGADGCAGSLVHAVHQMLSLPSCLSPTAVQSRSLELPPPTVGESSRGGLRRQYFVSFNLFLQRAVSFFKSAV